MRLWETESTTPKVNVRALVDALAADRTALEDLSTQRFIKRTIPADLFDKLSSELSDKIAVTESEIERASRFGVGGPMTLQSLSARVIEFGPYADWNAADPNQQRSILRSMVEQIVIHPAKHLGGNVFDPDRVELVWR